MKLLIVLLLLGWVASNGGNMPRESQEVYGSQYYSVQGPIVKLRGFRKAIHYFPKLRVNTSDDGLEMDDSNIVMVKYPEPNVPYTVPDFKCPQKNGIWPVFTNCAHYIYCVKGEPREKSCPSDLHYNPASKECDFPNVQLCPYQCPDPNGDFPLIGDCNSYIQCYNDVPQVRICPNNLHWDKEKKQCDEPEVANCPLKCPSANGTFSYIEDCNSYILCHLGVPHLKKCPVGLFFSMSSRTCQPHMSGICLKDFQCQGETGRMPVLGNCKMFLECTRDVLSTVTIRTCPGDLLYNYYTEQCEMADTTVCVDACPAPDGIFSIPGLCHYYKICTNGKSEILMCPNGLHFNPVEKQCDQPSNAGCLPKCMKSGEVDGIPGRCNQYVECIDGVAKVRPCPIDLHFNQLLHVCDVPANSGCEFKCPDKYGFYPIPGKCEEYYQCLNGTAVHQRCPSKLYFNNRIKMCDFPVNSRCASVCPKSEGFFPVEGDCAAYVKCDNFVPTIVSCDEGHYFNVLTSDCEIARNVSCEPQCPAPNGRFSLPGESSETFIECIDNTPTIKSCSVGLRLNPESENCD